MNKKVVKIMICLLVVQLSFTVNAARKNNENASIPLELKPERMKLLEQLANKKVLEEELPFTEETADILKKMLNDKDDFIHNSPSKIQKMSRSLDIPMGVTDGKFEVIYLAPNLSTTLVFVDKLGNPWTIEKHSVSTPSKVQPEIVNSNMMTFSPKKIRGEGNMTLFFKDSNFPITLEWIISDKKVDYVTEVKIDGYGNKSPQNNMMRLYVGGNNVAPKYQSKSFSTMISGNTPLGFSLKSLFNEYGEEEDGFNVWVSDGGQHLYTRTIHKVFYPPTISVKKSGDKKTKVYKTKFSSRITVKKDGKLLHLKVR